MKKEQFFDAVKKFLSAMKKISAEKTLLIWALVMIAGISIFVLIKTSAARKEITLIFASWWEDEMEEQTLEKLITEYKTDNPGINIRYEKMNWEEIRESLDNGIIKEKGRTAQNLGPPDIFSIDPYAVYELENKSYLAKLENNKDSSANVVSIASFINPLYYNIDLLEAAGFDRPPKNQTEFLSYAQRLKETGVNGAGLALGNPHNTGRQFLSWIWASGNNFGSSGSFDFSSKEVISTLNFLNQLKQNLYSDPFKLSEAGLVDAFGKGKIAMMIGSIANIRELKNKPVNFSITTIPASASYEKKPSFPITVWYAGVNSKSEHQDEAKQFISFLKEKSADISASAYAVPGDGTFNRELSTSDPYYTKAFDMYEAGEMYNSPYFDRIHAIVHREAEQMFRGNITPEQCAEAIQQGWEMLNRSAPVVH